MKKRLAFLLVISMVALTLIGCGSNEDTKSITIGGKADTEAHVLANLAKLLLEEKGFEVDTKLGVKSVLARQALENSEVDLYYEYTGTAYTVYHNQDNKEIMTNPQAVYKWVKKEDKKKELIWLDKIDYNNTYTIMVRKEDAEKWGIDSITDLAKHSDELTLTFGTDTEFYNRPDGLKSLMKRYNLEFDNIKKMSAGIIYKALKEDKIETGMGYSTDGRIPAFGFINLEDDKNFFPVYNPAPVIREEVLEKYPEIEKALEQLNGKLTTEDIQTLNSRVDIEHQEPEKVAEEWLKENNLI